MDYHEYDVMARYPMLAASEDLLKWTGFITTATGKTIRLSIAVPEFPWAKNIQLVVEDLDDTSVRFWAPLFENASMGEGDSFLTFLDSLEAQVFPEGRTVSDKGAAGASTETDIYSAIVDDIEAIGIKKVIKLTPDFREIIFKHVDRHGREHLLKILIPDGYPRIKPDVRVELPFPEDKLQWSGDIKEIHKTFLTQVDSCCSFWRDMEELDNIVRVLDPLQSNKSHYHRKILLEDNVVMHLIFNPIAPRALPQISFAGPEKIVEAYNVAVDQDCNMWDDSLKVLQNLKSMLSCEFVMKEDEDEEGKGEEEEEPCLICYVYSFEGEMPEISCVCGSTYHRQCILDLFVSDLAKQVGLRRMVECPNCQAQIKVPSAGVAGSLAGIESW